MRSIKLADNLTLPADATTETLAILARKGNGKTFTGCKLFEEMWACGAQCVAIDPVGKWWSLRLAADGKGAGIDVPIFGGPRGDLPLEPTAGALIARVIVERSLSAVIDVSLFEDRDMKRFVTDFARELYKLKQREQSVLHLFVEEASTFMPQDKEDGNDPPMLNAFKKIVRKGRNYGIGVTLIDQRAQDVNKKVLNQAGVLIALGTTGTTDRAAIEKWVRDKHIDTSGLDELASLTPGDAFVWLPQKMTFTLIHVAPRWTYDASATPKLGAKRVERKLTPMDVAALRDAIGESVKRVEAEDPKALQRRIVELERRVQLAENNAAVLSNQRLNNAPLKAPLIKRVEVSILKDTHVKRLEDAFARSVKAREAAAKALGGVAETIARTDAALKASIDAVHTAFAKYEVTLRRRDPVEVVAVPPACEPPREVRPPRASVEGAAHPLIGKAVDMLHVLAQRTRAGKATSRNQLALLTKLSPKMSTYRTYLSALNSRAFIEKRSDGLYATDAGLAEAGDVDALPADDQLIELWCDQLVGKASDMLRALAAASDGLTREGLAEAVGLTPSESTYRTYLSKLNSCALIAKRAGRFYLTDELKG